MLHRKLRAGGLIRGLHTSHQPPHAPPSPAPLCSDAGSIEHVAFKDCTISTRYTQPAWWGAAEVIHVTAVPRSFGAKVCAPWPPWGLQPLLLRRLCWQ